MKLVLADEQPDYVFVQTSILSVIQLADYSMQCNRVLNGDLITGESRCLMKTHGDTRIHTAC